MDQGEVGIIIIVVVITIKVMHFVSANLDQIPLTLVHNKFSKFVRHQGLPQIGGHPEVRQDTKRPHLSFGTFDPPKSDQSCIILIVIVLFQFSSTGFAKRASNLKLFFPTIP